MNMDLFLYNKHRHFFQPQNFNTIIINIVGFLSLSVYVEMFCSNCNGNICVNQQSQYFSGDVKIVCGEPFKNFVPQPSVPREVGYGPSKLTESAGLLCPSHEGGIVFYKKYEEHIIKFLTTERLYLR